MKKIFIFTSVFIISLFFISCDPVIITPASVTAPKNLSIQEINSDTLTIKWDPVENASLYLIYESFDKIDFYAIDSTRQESYTIRDLQPGKTYYYKVESVFQNKYEYESHISSSLYSKDSAILTVKMPFAENYELPSAEYLLVSLIPNGTECPPVSLNWKSVDSASFYKVFRKEYDEKDYTELASDIQSNTWSDTNIQNGKTYFYAVQALDNSGKKSELQFSTSISVALTDNISFSTAFLLNYGDTVAFNNNLETDNSYFSFNASGSGKAELSLDSTSVYKISLYLDKGTETPEFINSGIISKSSPYIFTNLTASKKYFLQICCLNYHSKTKEFINITLE
jgi:hypothetical protein